MSQNWRALNRTYLIWFGGTVSCDRQEEHRMGNVYQPCPQSYEMFHTIPCPSVHSTDQNKQVQFIKRIS